MEDLKKYDDETLKKELQRRIEEREKVAEERWRKYASRVEQLLSAPETWAATMQIINVLAPKHDRTSCSDDDTGNGFYSGENGLPRCTRCGLLDLSKSRDRLPQFIWLKIEFRFEGS